MKKLLIAAVLLSCVLMTGCTSVETPREHGNRLLLETDLATRLLVEDFDMFWLADRNCRLTKWPTRLGL